MIRNKWLSLLAIILIIIPITAVSALAPSEISFYGTAYINGNPSPSTTIVAMVDGSTRNTITSDSAGKYGEPANARFHISLNSDDGGKTIIFYISDQIAGQFQLPPAISGVPLDPVNLDLSATISGPGGGPGGGPGTGGGGGGAPSGENVSNIEVKECYDNEIFKDILRSYRYTHPINPVNFVNITGNINAGVITACVEVLKGTSSLVGSDAPGTVYKNINIWVGTKGFATPTNIKDARIAFEVNNSWFTNINISASQLSLLKWDGSKWIALDTSQTMQDATSIYFESGTTSFSSFAISGTSGITPIPTPGPTVSPVVTVTPPLPQPMALNWILYLLIVVIIIVAIYFFAIKKKK